jgi:hypothetical protein
VFRIQPHSNAPFLLIFLQVGFSIQNLTGQPLRYLQQWEGSVRTIQVQYVTVHYTTLHYTTLHHTTLHYTTLPFHIAHQFVPVLFSPYPLIPLTCLTTLFIHSLPPRFYCIHLSSSLYPFSSLSLLFSPFSHTFSSLTSLSPFSSTLLPSTSFYSLSNSTWMTVKGVC